MIKSVNLDKVSAKLFKKITKERKYGWFSKDVQQMIKAKYGIDKKFYVELLNDKQKERDVIEKQIKEIAKKINRLK